MKFASAVSQAESGSAAAAELLHGVTGCGVDGADLAVLFLTAPLLREARELAEAIRTALAPRVFLGVSCEGIAGNATEVERRAGAALLVGTLPQVTLQPFHIAAEEWSDLLADDERLQQRVGAGEDHRGQLVLADPFTTPVDELLPALDAAFHRPTFGGMASAAQRPGGNLLFLNDAVFTDGAVGVGLGGPIRLDTVVSQGCRPVGQPMVVTKAERNLIQELGRRPALEVAQEMFSGLTDAERELFQNGAFVGVVINEYQESFGRGDFLVRGLMGADPKTGSLALGDLVRAGQTVQFHVRDAASAHEELTELLKPHGQDTPPAGALLFSCNGRGTRMFPAPDHDAATTRQLLADVPLAGFFAMGELGPVGGKSFIHGHTASLVLFRPE